jgi:exodeoxyribonuclease V beta subunit
VTERTSPEPFNLCGPLPRGMTLLEASAGTGKTFTIAALTTRYVAEMGKPIDRLLVITFTRMATGELRERVREHLVRAFDGLVGVLAGAVPPQDDDIVRLLADAPRPVQEERRDRLAKAVADFDAATIETTHGFCLQVLYGLGTAGDVDRDVTLVEDVRDLMDEVVDDLYLRKFAHRPNVHGFTHADAVTIARKVLDHPDAAVVPAPTEGDDLDAVRARFAAAFDKEMERRKRALKIMTYDDVLLRLRETLRDPVRGPHARNRLRERYEVVLVDEFQDTDPVQWEIMQRAFGDHDTTLVLIGDPKQAIYAFRGADVQAYLKAKDEVSSEWTLDENWRSDKALLEAYDALFGNAQLGQGGIDYRRVRAAAANAEPRLRGVPVTTPLRVRIVHVADGLVGRTKDGLKAADARAFIATDLAEQVVELLSAGGEVMTRGRDGTDVGWDELHPGHIAVLVRSNTHAAVVRDALHDAGVPVVIGGAGSVFVSEAARDWLRLLEALERPAARDRAALTALTRFVGWTAEEVALADETQWEDLHWALHRWAALLRDKGIAALAETVSSERSVPERVLARANGERFMTDLRHVVQLLHAAGATEGVGPTAMANWLGRRIREADRDSENEERTRRLESDARAVQVITIHRSKGLEFPIVLFPYAWDGYIHRIGVPVFHDPGHDHVRTVDVGGPGRELEQHRKLEKVEGQGEALRLFYVALTRAQHQTVLWWARGRDTGDSPLSRLMFDRAPTGEVAPYGMKKARPDDEVEDACTALGQHVSVERIAAPTGARLHQTSGPPGELRAAVFGRSLDATWRRVSYSGITHDAHQAPTIGSEPEDEGTTDEPASDVSMGPRTPGAASGPAPVALGLAGMPGGTLVGTIVHEVLERTAFDAPDLAGEVDRALSRELTRRNADLGNRADVIAGLCTALESPLGPLVGDVRLADLARGDRLDELGFEFPLIGGETADRSLRLDVADVAALLEAHLEPGDPVRPYAARLREPSLDGLLRGYLNGSLDLVFRHDGRYVLADYKTNRLCGPEETLTSWHYRPDALQAEMRVAHYPLQALLYSVALHRYLRWRLPDYEVDRHFGGVLYLFLRGMSAVEPVRSDGDPCGVWSWRPPSALVEALSDLFDEGRPS